MYSIVKEMPVARFYYQGNHSHPIRRTVLIIEDHKDYIVGYELRNGTVTRKFAESPVKSYNKNRISRYCELRKYNKNWSKSKQATLKRFDLLDLVVNGC